MPSASTARIGSPRPDATVSADPVAFYRFYLLRADDHIARRREDYAPNDAAAIGYARQVVGDYAGVEIWCGPRKVVTLSREEVARVQPPVAARSNHRAALLIRRNKRLLQQATATCRRTVTLCGRPIRSGGGCQCTRERTSGEPNRLVLGGGTSTGILSVRSGWSRRHMRSSSSTLMPDAARPA